jgi:NADH-quinone oxidoreductase subunit G
VQICPVGALTAGPYRFRARPWDLQEVGSTCTHCTTGCDISVQSSQNQVLRFLGVDNDHTSHGWLSDKCRFGFEFIGSQDRLRVPLVKADDGEFREATWAEALDVVAERLRATIAAHGGESVAGLGGARGTNEDAYAFGKFLRVAVGTNHVDVQMDDGLDPQFLAGVAGRATIDDLERAQTILLWGPDLKEENGTLYLRVRRAAQTLGAALIVVHPRRTGLDDRATYKFTYRPGEGAAVLAKLAAGEGEFAAARRALESGPVVALVGRTGYTESPRLAEAVAAFARDLPDARVLPLVRRSNTYGALDMGLAPTLLPGRVSLEAGRAALGEAWGPLPETPGRDTRGILEALREGTVKALMLMGADPVRDVPDGALAAEALDAAEFTVALDLFVTDSGRRADVILPVMGFAEKDGTVTNLEGRVQKVNQIVPALGQARPDWSVLDDLARRMGTPISLSSAELIAKEIASVAPAYAGVTWDVLDWDAPEGAVVPLEDAEQPLQYVPVGGLVEATGSRPDGAFALHYARTLYDDGVLMRHGRSLNHLAPGGFVALHSQDAERLGIEEGSTVTVGEVPLPVRFDSSLVPGTVYVPFNQPGVPSLGDGLEVTIRAEGGA